MAECKPIIATTLRYTTSLHASASSTQRVNDRHVASNSSLPVGPTTSPMATAATTSAAAIPTGGGGRRQHPHPRRPGLRPRRLHRLRLPAQAAATAAASSPSTSSSSSSSSTPAEGGGRLVAELVGAFNELTGRMGEGLATSSSSRLLFRALKLALPALRDGDGGRALARALAIAASLADLQVVCSNRMIASCSSTCRIG